MANSSNGTLGMQPFYPSARTPGSLGVGKDPSDPSTPQWFTGDTPGPLGVNDHADPDTVMCRLRTTIDGIPQAATLSDAKAGKVKKFSIEELETMSPGEFAGMASGGDRKAWVLKKLGRYQRQMHESANNQRIPVQLLAVVVLNELLDINTADIVQEDLDFVTSGSFGIAQIQASTALRDNLIPRDSQFRYAAACGMLDVFVKARLQVAQFAIEAAAKELRILIDNIKSHSTSAWVSKFGFDPTKAGEGQSIYDGFDSGSEVEKEMRLAEMVDAAYNSPDIIVAAHPEKYKNAPVHGSNAAVVAKLLYTWKLFRPC